MALLADAGYRYDSSRFGPTWTTTGPSTAVELVELALPGHSPMPLPFHPSYSLVLGTWYFRLGLARHRGRGPLVLLFHLTDFADPLPETWLAGSGSRVFTLSFLDAATKRRRCGWMLDLVRREYRLMSTHEALRDSASWLHRAKGSSPS